MVEGQPSHVFYEGAGSTNLAEELSENPHSLLLRYLTRLRFVVPPMLMELSTDWNIVGSSALLAFLYRREFLPRLLQAVLTGFKKATAILEKGCRSSVQSYLGMRMLNGSHLPASLTRDTTKKRRLSIPCLSSALIVGLLLYGIPVFSCRAWAQSRAPVGGIDWTFWELQLPTGRPGNPDIIPSKTLRLGQDEAFHSLVGNAFATSHGITVMKVPGSPAATGCVVTTNSQHCRTELREVDQATGKPSAWNPNASRNRLVAALAVPLVDHSQYGTVVGQIHFDDRTSNKPLCELYLNDKGDITIGIEESLQGGKERFTHVASIRPGSVFVYELRYERLQNDVVLQVRVNSGPLMSIPLGGLPTADCYFKAGNYNQSTGANSWPSEVHLWHLEIFH